MSHLFEVTSHSFTISTSYGTQATNTQALASLIGTIAPATIESITTNSNT